MQRKCIHELSASFSYSYGNSYKQMLKATPSNALAWVKAVQDESPGLKPMAPVMHQLSFEAACKQGAVIGKPLVNGCPNS